MPPDTPTTTTNGTANSTATGGSGGGGGVLPDGWELLKGAMQGALDSFASGVGMLVDKFNYHLLTLPAAGEPMSPATWTSFDDPYWLAVATVYGMLTAFVLPLVWGVGWFNVGYNRNTPRRDRIKSVAKALFLIIGGWPLLMFWFHFWNQAALAFVPSGAEFLATPGNATKLGIGVALGVLILAYNALIILAGILIHLMFVFLTFVTVAIWPLSVGLYMSDVYAVDTVGGSGIATTLLLSPLQFVKALLLRLVFEFPLSVENPESVTTLLLVAVGVTLAFVGVPYYGIKRLLPRSVVSVGRRGKYQQKQRMSNLQERAPSGAALKERVHEVSSRASSRIGRGNSGDGSSLQSRDRSVDSTYVRPRNQNLYGENAKDTRTRRYEQRTERMMRNAREQDDD